MASKSNISSRLFSLLNDFESTRIQDNTKHHPKRAENKKYNTKKEEHPDSKNKRSFKENKGKSVGTNGTEECKRDSSTREYNSCSGSSIREKLCGSKKNEDENKSWKGSRSEQTVELNADKEELDNGGLDSASCDQSDHGNCSEKETIIRPLNKMMEYEVLESLVNNESSCILTTLADPKSGFQELMNNRPLKPDLIILSVYVLIKVIESDNNTLKIQILSETFTPELMNEIKRCLGQIHFQDHPFCVQGRSIDEFFANVLTLFETCIVLFPSIKNERLKSVVIALSLSMKNSEIEREMKISDDGLNRRLKKLIDNINEYIENTNKDSEKQSKIGEKQSQIGEKQLIAPDNFRDIPLIPTKRDFMHRKAFLRKNIIKGSFIDVEQYLDIQFRLLREDFIAPLRTGISEYIGSLSIAHIQRKYSNVKIHPKVQFQKSVQSKDKFVVLVNFDCDQKLHRSVNWEYNKRFTVGSLLLFSDNHFQTFYLATIAERNIKQLEEKILCVSFVPGNEPPDDIFKPESFFVMVESEVFYEAYRHVLNALQRMNEQNFPMKRFIVDADTSCFPPAYTKKKSVYNIFGHKVNILKEDSWPTPDQLKLNTSQHRAFQSALTNNFVVIQGPPGTGKTFLSLKIAEVLLKNKVFENTPLVVVCYTNHALDQFLEGMLQFTTKLIRIGSQSQNEALEKYNIHEIRLERKNSKVSNHSAEYKDTMSAKFEIHKKLQIIDKKIEELDSKKGILDLGVIRSVVTVRQFNELRGQEVTWLLCHDSADLFALEERLINDTGKRSKVPEKLKLNTSSQDINEFEEEEFSEDTDDEEIANCLPATLKDDDFECFIRETNFSSSVNFRLDIDKIRCKIIEESKAAKDSCDSNDSKRRMNEMIQQIDIIQSQYSRFQDFRFNSLKFKMLENVASVWDISPRDRWEYYMTWVHLYKWRLRQTIEYLKKKYQRLVQKIYDLKQLDDLEFVREADVIGLTTSGAAKRRMLLENLGAKIVMVEEAAEVLEAHIVTSLTQSVEHVILIGDHKQLKPSPAVLELAKKYNLEVSLFERMVNNGLGCCVLDVQHRMRPEIASLVSPIYPTLNNHSSTLDRPRILGVDKFVYFLFHNEPEDQVSDSASRQNKYEAHFLIALCNYLLMQGHRPEEITILASYTGQVWYLKREKRRLARDNEKWKSVRITQVDNFQGEENRIILLSLVRSNQEGKIGFLSSENRVCVALSRAREGFYIVGNMENLTRSSTIWPKIKTRLEEIGAVGSKLTLRCELHKDQVTLVSAAEHFSCFPEGGCALMCETQLDCGHICPRSCHAADRLHKLHKCQEPCNRSPCKVDGHMCPLRCWQECQPCEVLVEKQLPCEHLAQFKCSVDPSTVLCNVPVPVPPLDCGHEVPEFKPCHRPYRCTRSCSYILPCGHVCIRRCHVNDDPDHLEYVCKKNCTRLNIGCRRDHRCPKLCHEECASCSYMVLTEMSCGHSARIICSKGEASILCTMPCNKLLPCGHPCLLECYIPCDPRICTVEVDKVCAYGHTLKDLKCNQPVEWIKCMEPCSRPLACGHPCTEKCYIDCASIVCQVLVNSTVLPACGHPPPLIPCHLDKQGLDPGSDELLQLCKAECRDRLMCSHVCSGVCGDCMQGRLHVPCQERCNKQLICGHQCQAACSELCPPCPAMECFNNCRHDRCFNRHTCTQGHRGEHLCKQRCGWKCFHFRCTKYCKQDCDRPVCNKPCTSRLRCGHICVGYCGEQHICSICDAYNFISSNHQNDRFVWLEDCGHVIAAEQLQELVRAATRGDIVRLIRCPLCEWPVAKTPRCRNIFLRFCRQLQNMSQLIFDETFRLLKIHAEYAELLKSSPTKSEILNGLLSKCGDPFTTKYRSEAGRLLLACLLIPLAQLDSTDLTGEEEQRLRVRLDYLGTALAKRIGQINYQDMLQVELEVARVQWAVSTRAPVHHWYDISRYRWENNRADNQQTHRRICSTLKIRDITKEWYQCEKKHLYVSEDGEPCTTCAEEETQDSKPNSSGNYRKGKGQKQHKGSFPGTKKREKGRGNKK